MDPGCEVAYLAEFVIHKFNYDGPSSVVLGKNVNIEWSDRLFFFERTDFEFKLELGDAAHRPRRLGRSRKGIRRDSGGSG
jgi:hypothetical protein